MGKIGEETDFKSQLVREICSIASRSSACTHHRPITKIPFIDWYLLLQVDENAEIEMIRKQYLKLALQLHPDKNRHPKAEVAFKLVSEAYVCLTHQARRTAFDIERSNNFCADCNKIRHRTSNSHSEAAKFQNKNLHHSREVIARFREEVMVIENCLKTHKTSMKEYPLFNPSNNLFRDYPHPRTDHISRQPEDFWYLRRENVLKYDQRRGRCESPIFEIQSERRSFRSKSACCISS